MIKAVIFDCFGVLTTESWTAFKQQYFGSDAKLMEQVIELNKQSDAGAIAFNDAMHKVAQLAGVDFEQVDAAHKGVSPNHELLKYIETDLKPHYAVGMLSNVAYNWLNVFLTNKEMQLFDTISLSYESGIPKPDPRAYSLVLEELKIKAVDAIFIDDSAYNVKVAVEQGMKGIVYKDFAQMKADLQKILDDSKS